MTMATEPSIADHIKAGHPFVYEDTRRLNWMHRDNPTCIASLKREMLFKAMNAMLGVDIDLKIRWDESSIDGGVSDILHRLDDSNRMPGDPPIPTPLIDKVIRLRIECTARQQS